MTQMGRYLRGQSDPGLTTLSTIADKLGMKIVALPKEVKAAETMMIAEGVNTMVLQRRMGHTSIQVTYDNYGHLVPDVDRGIEDKIIRRVTGFPAQGADNTRTRKDESAEE